MKKQKLGGILAIKKNVISRLNANDVNAGAMGGSNTVTICNSCTGEECCFDGPGPTHQGSWCRCK